MRRQVEGWSQRYRAAITDDVPDGEEVMAWLDAHQPEDVAARMIHGDWRFDNLVVDPENLSRVRAVLDWEMATVGDPLMDLGASLAYWVQADDDPVFQMFRRQPSNLPGMPTRAEVVAHYLGRTGLTLPAAGGGSTRCTGCSGSRSSPSRSGTGTEQARRPTPRSRRSGLRSTT